MTKYGVFCQTNQIPFDKPTIHYEPPIPLIPSTQDVQAIINHAGTQKTATAFTIMSETGIEGAELRRTPRTQINAEKGIISVVGTKQHSNGKYKLKPKTAQMLRELLAKTNKEFPFPTPKSLGKSWCNARVKASHKLSRPELLNIPMKNLRNYAGAIFYKGIGHHEPIATMRFMRHKCLETTLHYIRGINLDEPEEYTTVSVKTGEPDTQKQIIEYANAGYQFFDEADGYKFYRIKKHNLRISNEDNGVT